MTRPTPKAFERTLDDLTAFARDVAQAPPLSAFAKSGEPLDLSAVPKESQVAASLFRQPKVDLALPDQTWRFAEGEQADPNAAIQAALSGSPAFDLNWSGVVNTGVPVFDSFWGNMVLDMAGAQVGPSNYMMRDHIWLIGQTEEWQFDPAKGATAKGYVDHLMPGGPDVIILLVKNYRIQMSISAAPMEIERLEEGQELSVNNRPFQGPGHVFRVWTAEEASATLWGADDKTSITRMCKATTEVFDMTKPGEKPEVKTKHPAEGGGDQAALLSAVATLTDTVKALQGDMASLRAESTGNARLSALEAKYHVSLSAETRQAIAGLDETAQENIVRDMGRAQMGFQVIPDAPEGQDGLAQLAKSLSNRVNGGGSDD